MVEELDELCLRQAMTYPKWYSQEIRQRDVENDVSS